MSSSHGKVMRLFLAGDVMTGRGIDQILPYPGHPRLHEAHAGDARTYVQLAEAASGPIPQPVGLDYIWGDVLDVLQQAGTDRRIINLETAITSSESFWPDKEVHYRMHPQNIGCITAARIDCCCLANNHVLDWGYQGLEETVRTLDLAGVIHAGAGSNAAEAASPARLDVAGKGRVLVFAFGSTTSGIAGDWGAGKNRPGVNLLNDLSESTARHLAARICRAKLPGDIVVASIHWGSNWGFGIPHEQIAFAHALVEGGVDIIHGHSSHHVKTIEVYRDRLILYGCGDLVTDYEGIHGYEQYRGDLALMYLVTVDPGNGQLLEARLVPMRAQRFRLQRASEADAKWVCGLLNTIGAPFSTEAHLENDNSVIVRW